MDRSIDLSAHDSREARGGLRGQPLTAVTLRPIASPLPLALIALAVGSFVLAGLQLHWIAVSQGHVVGICLLAFVAPLQLSGFLFGVAARDEATASGVAVLSGCWIAIGVALIVRPAGSISGGLGLLLAAAAACLVIPAAVALSSKPLVSAVFLLAALRFALTAVYQLGGGSAWQTATAAAGLLLSAVAFYAAAAFALENARRRQVLPIGRRNPRSAAAPDATNDPIGPVTHDAGVRAQL